MQLGALARLFLCLALLYPADPASCGSFLDDYLHNIRLDQATEPRPGPQGQWTHQSLTAGHTFGQTFTTGPDVMEVYQIAVESPWWNETWGKGTSLVMALYDGPAKATKLAEFEMKYEWRQWEDMKMVFPTKAAVEPNRTYYFELSTRGGDGTVGPIMTAPGDYARGQAYIDGKPQGFDFIFQTYVHTSWDRDATCSEAFAKFNLDYPGMEKVKSAVQAKDWDRAAKELVAHFESVPQRVPPPEKRRERKVDPKFDREAGDLAAAMSLKDADDNVVSLGPNWNHLRWWPTRGGIGLTRSGIRKDLAHAYSQTGDEKYAIAWNDMLKAVFVDLPSPIKAGILSADAKDTPPVLPGGIAGGSMWAGLSTGARMGHGFAYYATFVDSPNFTWDVRAAFIMNMADMADVLAAQKGGGNWATQMTDSLFEFGKYYPEFARAKEFFQTGYDGLLANMRETLSADGPIGESQGYQGMVHGRYIEVPGDARKLGLPFPEDLRSQIERAVEFHMYTTQPDGHSPAFGDGNPDSTSADILRKGAAEFGRKDMLWVATAGKEGEKPRRASIEYPYSNYYVMRSDWGPDGLFMCLKNGAYTSHGHKDSLGFVLHALGHPVFVDPGTYIYGTPEAMRHNETRSHSTISVDGRNLQNAGGPNQFFNGRSADILVAQGPGYDGLPDSIRAVRRVAFLKPDYWVLSDVVRGEGEHQVDSRFHFADKSVRLDAQTGRAHTTHTGGGNLSVLPVDASGVTGTLEEGDVARAREQLQPAWILKQSAKATLPLRLDNVLYPHPPNAWSERRIPRELVPGSRCPATAVPLAKVGGSDAETSGVRVNTPWGSDFVAFTGGSAREARFSNGLHCAAQAAVVRCDRKGGVRSFTWMWGRLLSRSGKTLAVSDDPVPGLDVVYEGSLVRVTTRGQHPSLRVAALGAKSAVVNGGPTQPIEVVRGMFGPFPGKPTHSGPITTDDEMPGFAIEKPLVGGSAGGEDQIGFTYHWCHVSPGRRSLMSWTPRLPQFAHVLARPCDVSVFVPHTSLDAGATREAHYIVKFAPDGKWWPSQDRRVTSMDASRAASGVVELRVDQAEAAGTWVKLGRFTMGKNHRAKLELQADGETRGPVVLADAAKWEVLSLGRSAGAEESE